MTAQEILNEIEPLGRESYRKVLFNHGVPEPCFGVKIEELKKIQKRVGMDYRLALDLFETRVYDAMYLAGLIADDAKMSKMDLQSWVEKAKGCLPLEGFTVAWVAAGSPHGLEMGLKWIESKEEGIAAAGWATLGALVAIRPDVELELGLFKKLLQRVEKEIHQAPNAARRAMNNFVIAVGTYVAPLSKLAMETGEKIGVVKVDVGNTSCSVPFAPDSIRKIEQRGAIGKKRKTVKC